MSKDDTVKIKEVITEILEKYQNKSQVYNDFSRTNIYGCIWNKT